MPLSKKTFTHKPTAWLLFPAAIIACLLGYNSVVFFSGSELIFGNIIAIIVLFTYGLLPAVIVSVLSSIAAYFNWGSAFSIAPFLFEILALHWAIKTQRNPVYIGLLYWASIGWVIVAMEVYFFSDFELSVMHAITIKYVINGLINILVGYAIAHYILTISVQGSVVNKQKFSVLLTNQLFYIVTISGIVISFFWLKAFQHKTLVGYQLQLQMQANHVTNEIENHILIHQKALIISVLNNNNITEPNKIQQVLQHLKDTYPGILTLLSTDENGDVIATSPKSMLSKSSGNVADRSYFHQVKKNGKPYFSNVFKGRSFGNDPLVAISVAFKHDKGFSGVIEASLNLELLTALDRKEIASEEGLMILDQNNRVIYASKNLNYEFLKNLSGTKLLKHLAEPDNYYLQDELGNDLILKSTDSKFLGWTIISTVPLSVYDAIINRYMAITLSLLGLFILLSFALARWLAQTITKPINALSDALNGAENPEDLLDLKLTTGNHELIEITNVEKKLNVFALRSKQLMSDLEQANVNQDISNEQLLELNSNLERIVSSKTKELKIALIKATDATDASNVAKGEAEQAARGTADFLAIMSHEIRTPMNGVLGTAELLNATSLTPVQRDYVDTLLNSGKLLLTVVDDVLVYSKLDAGKVALEIVPINLEHLLHEILKVMGWSLTKNVELILDYPPSIPVVFMGDPDRLRQVLFNLVGNAIKFTERGSISILARFDGQSLTLEVKDTGIGITQEQQKNLFKAFNQADTSISKKYGGTGLGLAISKNLINLMGGEITTQSEYGKGSSFIISLKLAAEIKPEPEKIFNNAHIILVERDKDNFRMVADLLRYHGAQVTQCAEIELVIDQLSCIGAEESLIPLVLISNNISADNERKHGIELRSHPQLKNIPIVVLSSSRIEADLEQNQVSVFAPHLTKPIRSDLLISGLKASILNEDPSSLTAQHSLSSSSQSNSVDIQFKGHILLVEDIVTNQFVAKTLLSNMGLTVDLAEDGLQAITKWQKNNYDLIFMDCYMPNMDGFQATREIRAKEHVGKTPIIALTANVTDEDRIKCHESGMDAVVTKPFKPSDLHRVLSKWLDTDADIPTSSGVGQFEAELELEPVTAAAIDLEKFNSTKLVLGEKFPLLVDSIFIDIDNIFEKLSNWADPLDIEGFGLLPHSLRSSSGYIGAIKLIQLAEDCENYARAGDVEKALTYMDQMNIAYQDVIKDLAKLGYNKSS